MKVPQGKIKIASLFVFLILAMNFMAAQKPLTNPDGDLVPNGKHGNPTQTAAPVPGPIGDTVVTGNGISYHGGPVLKSNPVPIYLIFYGNWNGTGSNTAASVSLIEHFVSTLGNTPYEKIATTYGDTTGNVSGNVSLGGVGFRSPIAFKPGAEFTLRIGSGPLHLQSKLRIISSRTREDGTYDVGGKFV